MDEFDFGSIVKRERSKQELTLKELSDLTNGKINPSYINRMESGKQSNPSFDVVAELCKALNLDIREVFRSFGYESLIKDYDQEAVFSIEEVIRLHKVKLPVKPEHQDELAISERFMGKEEQEQVIKLVYGIFEYAFVGEAESMDKLTSIIKQIHVVRELQKKDLSHVETLEVRDLDITYTIQFTLNIKRNISNFESWKEDIKNAIDNYGNLLRDYPNGVVNIPIGKQEWLIQKENNILKLLFKKSDIVSL